MIGILLAKDLRRARRNPLPWMINLLVPLVMTALIGMVFGGHADSGSLGRIHFAVVDEDQSFLSKFLRGMGGQEQGSKYLDPVFMSRAEALREINANHLSAVLIIPTNFTSHYLQASAPVSLELIKNPAESIHPAVLEELLGALVTGLNGISRNFNSEFPVWQAALTNEVDYDQLATLVKHTGEKLKAAKTYLNPPLVVYETEAAATNQVAAGSTGTVTNSMSGIFGYLLVGLAAMFLLFIAGNAMADLHRELSLRTFPRYQTLQTATLPFLLAKIIYVMVVVLVCAAIMLGGGGLVFQIHWEHPLALMALTMGYAGFIATWFAVLVALLPDERRAAVLTNLSGMGLGLLGGCAFPPQQLPGFIRHYVMPWLPSHWFAETARNLQGGETTLAWTGVVLQLAAVSVGLAGVAIWLFRRRFNSGLRA